MAVEPTMSTNRIEVCLSFWSEALAGRSAAASRSRSGASARSATASAERVPLPLDRLDRGRDVLAVDAPVWHGRTLGVRSVG